MAGDIHKRSEAHTFQYRYENVTKYPARTRFLGNAVFHYWYVN